MGLRCAKPNMAAWALTMTNLLGHCAATSLVSRYYVQVGVDDLPLKVIRPGAPIITLSEKEHAERLFVAKGCRACHENGIGPTLTGKKLSANYVSRMLKDPAATQNRSSRAGMWQMPNLNLTAEHVAELTAFLTGQ